MCGLEAVHRAADHEALHCMQLCPAGHVITRQFDALEKWQSSRHTSCKDSSGEWGGRWLTRHNEAELCRREQHAVVPWQLRHCPDPDVVAALPLALLGQLSQPLPDAPGVPWLPVPEGSPAHACMSAQHHAPAAVTGAAPLMLPFYKRTACAGLSALWRMSEVPNLVVIEQPPRGCENDGASGSAMLLF